jgi:hypothetical protein
VRLSLAPNNRRGYPVASAAGVSAPGCWTADWRLVSCAVRIDIWLGPAFERDSGLVVATHKGAHLREAINVLDAAAVWTGDVGRFHLNHDSGGLVL